MKSLALIVLALSLTACGHEMTKLDRELALKLADRPQIVVANQPAPIVINNYSGAPQVNQQAMPIASEPFEESSCSDAPKYDMSGRVIGHSHLCFGTR